MTSDDNYRQRIDVAAGDDALSIVVHESAREWRPGWISLLAARVFALRTRRQDGDTSDDDDAPAADTPEWRSEAPISHDAIASIGPTAGEDAAFDAFFAQHERPLYGYLRRMLTTHDAALDVAQEAFFRAWQRFETIRHYDRPQAWLFRVATNLALDTLRRRQLMGLTRLPGMRDTEASNDVETDDTSSLLMDPFDMEQTLMRRDLVHQALQHLPERQRAAVLLWAAHGLTIAEIATAIETTEVNVRQLLSRGRARFRETYEQMWESS